jgi:hypothetical protein
MKIQIAKIIGAMKVFVFSEGCSDEVSSGVVAMYF